MKPQFAARLCCPKCRSGLIVTPFERSPDGQVVNGLLLCDSCRVWYPVENHVPVLLVFATSFHRLFACRHSSALAAHPGYHPPAGQPRAGEKSIQETFTDEWRVFAQGDHDLSFTYTTDDLIRLNREVWLRRVVAQRHDLRAVLNVGCGVGTEAVVLSQLFERAEIVAVDLNFALVSNGARLAAFPRMHPMICSLFDIPLAPGSFDLVYSQGVLHHTYSTKEGFRAVSAHVAPGGFLFVWVYALDDFFVLKGSIGFLARVAHWGEKTLRPVISRLPHAFRNCFFALVAPVAHPLVMLRVRHKDKWRLKNTEHGLRDFLSPRYAHSHSHNEVLEWFEESGFAIVDVQSPLAYRRLFGKRLFGVGCTGQKVRPDGVSSSPTDRVQRPASEGP